MSRTISAAPTYKTAMNGTIFSVTLAMDLMPPTITKKTAADITTPVIQPLPASTLCSPPLIDCRIECA